MPTTNASRPIKSSKDADLSVVLFKKQTKNFYLKNKEVVYLKNKQSAVLFKTQTKNAYSKNKKVVYLKNKQHRFLNNSEVFLKKETKNLYSKSKEGVEILAQLI